MNGFVAPMSFILLFSTLAGAMHDIAGKRSILESLVPGVNIPASGIGLSSGIPVQVPPHPIAIQVPHPVAVPVPHPIVVPVERPVPFPVDRPVPYPVTVVKKYFIPVPFKILKTIPIPVPAATSHDGPGSGSGSDFGNGSEITADSYRIYTNGRAEASSLSSGNDGDTAIVDAPSLPASKSTKRNSSFRIHVN